MDRGTGRTSAPPSNRRGRDAVVTAGLGVIILFAIVGVVSAGMWVGGKLTGSSQHAASPRVGVTGSKTAQADIARAQAQATRIVKTAQDTGKTIVNRETARAKKQAASIVIAARHRASVASHSTGSSSSGGTGSAAAGGQSAPAATGGGTQAYTAPSNTGTQSYGAAGSTGAGTYSSGYGTGTSGYGASSGTSGSGGYNASGAYSAGSGYSTRGGTSTGAGTSPSNLAGLPSSWLVVGYNATFGSGPGSAGSITVTNRSGKTFSGVARVVYSNGNAASAAFSGIAPGQTLVLPLNGPVYPGGKYSIQMTGLR